MKKLLKLLLMLFVCTCSLINAQNRSFGSILITIPFGLPPGNIEAFRFRPGLITQLDAGLGFDFTTNSQWSTLGRLSTPNQTLYGLRVQRAGKGLVFGYSGTPQGNSLTPTAGDYPFIQWIGNAAAGVGAGDLRFETAPDPTNTVSNLVFTLRSDKTALLGSNSLIDSESAIVSDEIRRPSLEINSDSKRGLVVNSSNAAVNSIFNNNGGGNVTTEFFSSSGPRGLGTFVSITERRATGVLCSATSSGNNIGISSLANQGISNKGGSFTATSIDAAGVSNYGVFASTFGSNVAGTINNGVFAAASGANALAGNFAGAVACTSLSVTSDKSLKTNIKKEDRVLEMLEKINPVTYTYIAQKENTRLNLTEKLQHGFIAQELQDVMPELVSDIVYPIFNDKNEQIGTKTLKSVNYIGLISVLTASVKELSQELKALKAAKQNAFKTFVLSDSNTKQFTNQELTAIQEKGYYLAQNTPNPFSSSTLIDYSLPQTDKNASILILNLNGQTIKTMALTESKGSVFIEAGSLQSGMYLYSLISDGVEIVTKKMIVK